MQGSLLFPPAVDQNLLPAGAWVMQGDFIIGDEVYPATVVYDLRDTQVKSKRPDQPVFLGFERGVVTLDDGTTFDLVGRFASPHQALPGGPWTLNEAGPIVGTDLSGQFTDHLVYGPGVPPLDPNGVLGAIGLTRGNICGLDRRH
jgi:hypothetical protein